MAIATKTERFTQPSFRPPRRLRAVIIGGRSTQATTDTHQLDILAVVQGSQGSAIVPITISTATSVSESDAAEHFVNGLQALADNGQLEAARLAIFNHTDDLLHAADFAALDSILSRVDADEFPAELLVTLARTARFAPENTLPSRAKFYAAVKHRLTNQFGATRPTLLDVLQ